MKSGVGLAAVAAALLFGGASELEYRGPRISPMERRTLAGKRMAHCCYRRGWHHGTPMIKGGKLAKRLKRGKLLFRP